MDYGPYSPLKAANIKNHHRLQALSENRVAVPAQVHLVITNRCNHNCSFCAYRSSRSTCSQQFHASDQILWTRGESLIKEIAQVGTGAIQFTGGGEPTVHPDFSRFYATAIQEGMEVALVTNGSRLHQVPQDLLQRSAWLRISLDAASPDTYASIRKTKDFSRVLNNIKTLVENKKKGGPVIGIGFVVSPDNYKETGAAIKLAHSLGVDNVRISAAFYEGAAEEHTVYADQVIDQITEARSRVAGIRVFDLFTDRLADLEQKRPDYKYCAISRLVPYIAADLVVYSCCVMSYNKQGRIGSLENKTFQQVWAEEGTAFFEQHDARRCDRCMFNEKNKLIAYMIDDNVDHVTWI